jgi:HTH-type transcriptional regulator/antitoxin HigA
MKLAPFRKNITTEEEYAKALDVLSTLVDKGDRTTAEETAYLELLGTLVEDYERRHSPEVEEAVAKPVTPVEAIRWAMDRHGLRQKDLAPLIGSESLVSSVLAGRRKLSKSMIARLHEALGIPFEHLFEPVRPGIFRRIAAAAL